MVLDIEIVGKVKCMKKLNQELYDLLFDAIGYIIEYSKKYWCPDAQKRRDKTNDREDSLSYGSNRTTNGIPITDKTAGEVTEPAFFFLLKQIHERYCKIFYNQIEL